MPPPAARMAWRGHVPDSSTKQHPGLPPAADKPSVRIRHPVSHAFVGTRGDNAAEYHDNDFVWETLCAAGQEAIRRQQLEASTARPGADETPPASHDWEEFHAQHSLGRFFKEKRYLPIEFPQLRTPGVTIGEVGCGCGSALIPVLRDNPTATAVACDVSGTAIQVFRDAAMPGAGIDSRRIRLSVNDFPNSSPFEDGSLDMAMIIFTLSAFHPNDMKRVVAAVRRGLKPGGLALVRDYGLYDMAQVRMYACMHSRRRQCIQVITADSRSHSRSHSRSQTTSPAHPQLRFHGSQLADPDHLVYRRPDGTLSHFFDIDALTDLFETAGFRTEKAKYCTVSLRNKKKDLAMNRVFVHGEFSVSTQP
jgi:methyltransferase-like protein 6